MSGRKRVLIIVLALLLLVGSGLLCRRAERNYGRDLGRVAGYCLGYFNGVSGCGRSTSEYQMAVYTPYSNDAFFGFYFAFQELVGYEDGQNAEKME